MRPPAALASLISLALAACLSSGGGSDTETLTGTVIGIDGKPAAGARVKLLPAGYDPSRPDAAAIRHARTAGDGTFRFEGIAPGGNWNLIAGDSARKSWALEWDVRPGTGSASVALSAAKVYLISLHGSAYAPADSGIAYFPGTDILVRCGGLSAAKVDSVPAEASRLVIESRAGWKHDTTWVLPADTAKVAADSAGIRFSP